jgi:peptidoglycan-associated lipoprotein
LGPFSALIFLFFVGLFERFFMKQVLFSRLSALMLSLTLVACGSNVKLNDVPVEDRAGGNAGQNAVVTAPSAAGQAVAPVQIRSADTPGVGPAGIARVIYFDYDSFSIRPEFQSAIDSHARFLTADKARKIAIEGHTDERGGREYNLALGQKRSEAVRRALALLGVAESQIEAVSLGEEKPAQTGSTEEAFSRNRRAEVNYR